jgi:O-antigen/teichoic acid export membrane protein
MFYGPGFQEIEILVRILSLYMILRSIGSPVGSLVIATGKTHLDLVWNSITFLVMPVVIYTGCQFGITGAAWGITAASILLFVPSWKILVHKMTGASLKEYLTAIFTFNIKALFALLKGNLNIGKNR